MSCSPLRSAVLITLLAGTTAQLSLAAAVQHEGTVQEADTLKTHGLQVESERALRDVVPDGWRLEISPAASLPGRVSWAPSDTWLVVLDRIAARSPDTFRINWELKTVFVEPSSATPVAEASVAVSGITEEAPIESTTPGCEPRAFNRTPLREPFEALAECHGLTLIYEAGNMNLPGPVTLMFGESLAADIELINRALGPTRHLEVIEYWRDQELIVKTAPTNSFVSLEGRPVIPERRPLFARVFGGRSKVDGAGEGEVVAAESGKLIEAVEPVEPVAVVASTSAPEATSGSAPVIPPMPVEFDPIPPSDSFVFPVEPTPAAEEFVALDEALLEPVFDVSAELPYTAVDFMPAALTLELAPGERLSVALERLLTSQGWSLIWRASIDHEAATAARVEGATLAEILELVLPQLGLAADLYNPSRTAVIRAAHESITQGAP